ncbi:MAG: ATPase [Bacteroidia bacterium]|nr:MAG: ATPase [Bacteroidia bacterium]
MKTIKLTGKIKGSPEEVYRALTNPFTIELWSGEPAVMSEVPGSSFSILDGAIVGENVAFETNKSLRQYWFFGEEHRSEVFIELFPDKAHTHIRIEHSGVPDEAYENMLAGWKESYLESLRDFFEK